MNNFTSVLMGSSAVKSNPIWNGLISYWRMDETSGTNVIDAVGSNNLINNGAGITTGKNNNCLNISANDYLSGTSSNQFDFSKTDSFSISLWCYGLNTTGSRTFVSKVSGVVGVSRTGYEFWVNAGRLYFYLFNEGVNTLVSYGTNPQFNTSVTTWRHCVCTYNGSNNSTGLVMYYQGNTFSTYRANSNLTTINNSSNIVLGNNYGNAYLNGKMDEVGIWNRVLSQSEVTSLYNSGNGLFY